MGVLLSLMMIMSCFFPWMAVPVYGNSLVIAEVTPGSSYLYPGDTFTLTVKLNSDYINPIKIDPEKDIYVSGSAVTTQSAGLINDVKYFDEENGGNQFPTQVVIQGLKYTGEGKDVTVYVAGASKTITLSAMTTAETLDALKVDDTDNVFVKAGSTQNAQVKVINQGKQTLKNVKVKLQLSEKIDGIKIKTEEATIAQLLPKEVKTASFSVEVDSEVKAKVYKATASVNGASFPVNLQVDSHIVPSALEVSNDEDKIFTPGVTQDANIVIKNVGERPAKNIRVEVSSESVAIVGGGNVKHIPVINARDVSTISLKLRIDGKTTQSAVPLKVDFSYLNSLGEEAKDTQYIYLRTTASAAVSEVVISRIISPAGIYGVNQNFNVQFDIVSKGGAEGLKVSVKGDEGIVPKSQNLFFISKLAAGEKKQYSVTMAATRAAVSSTHPIEITVEYGEKEKPIVISQYGSVNISNPEKDEEGDGKGSETKKGMPKVIIGTYKSTPVVVRAGEKFDLEIGFLNAHKTKAVHNLKASIVVKEEGEKDKGTVFAPVGASNTFYIADLAPRQTEMKKIKLYTIPSASPKTYEITLEMEYEDDKGNEVKATESLGIPVEQVTKVEVGDIRIQDAQVGAPAELSAILYNTGKTDISNMMIYIEGEGFTVQDNKLFVGNFEKGATQDYNPMIVAESPGSHTGRIIVEYEETTGDQKRIEKEFDLEVAEMPMPEEMPPEDPDRMSQKPGIKLSYILGIGAGVVTAAVVTMIILKKRKAKKEKMMLDEDN